MVKNLVIAVEAVAPMFLIMVIGVLTRRAGLINEAEAKRLNKLVFTVFFPPMMFDNLYGAEIGDAFDIKLIVLLPGDDIGGDRRFRAHHLKNRKGQPYARRHDSGNLTRSNLVIMGLPACFPIFSATKTSPPRR